MYLKKIVNALRNPQILKKSMFVRNMVLKSLLPLDFPYILNIEPTNACNLNCIMCPRNSSKKKVGLLSFELYKKIIDECSTHKKMFRLFLQKDGEPLLHPQIVDMVRYAKEKNVAKYVSIITNGVALNEELSKKLIEAELDEIIFSIDSVDKERYKKIKGKDFLQRVEGNVDDLIKLRTKLGAKKPFIHSRILNMQVSKEELAAFKLRWQNADDIDVIPFHTWHNTIEDVNGKNKQLPKRYPCSLLWYTGIINWDGDFSLCCIDYNSDGIVGNVNNQRIYDIWNGEEMRRIRRLHLEEKYKEIKICADCEYWRIKEDIGSWLKKKQMY